MPGLAFADVTASLACGGCEHCNSDFSGTSSSSAAAADSYYFSGQSRAFPGSEARLGLCDQLTGCPRAGSGSAGDAQTGV